MTETQRPLDLRADRFNVLRLDYEMAREDERSFQSIQAALVGVAVALTATLSAVLTRAGTLTGLSPADDAANDLAYVPEAVLVVVPLVPFALVAFVVLLGAVSTIRTYYLRALEAELEAYSGGPLRTLPIRPGAYTELISEMVSMRRGIRWYPYLALAIAVAALVIFGGFTFYIYSGLEQTAARLVMIAFYPPATAFLLVQAGQGTIGGRGLFTDVAQSYLARLHEGRGSSVPQVPSRPTAEGHVGRERSLTSYLVLPRPEELPKALIAPAVYLVGGLALGSLDGDSLIRAAVVLVALEYLIYEARYQWNDVRGVHEDHAHSDSSSRRRLPLGSDPPKSTIRHIRSSVLVAVGRIGAAVALAVAVGRGTLEPVAVLVVAVFAVAIFYEALRSWAADSSRPARVRDRLVRVIWFVVGGGYAVRGVTGLYLAGFSLGDEVVWIGAAAFGAYGIMFVTLTWALEALAESDLQPDSSLRPKPQAAAKPHVTKMLGYMDIPDPPYLECEECAAFGGTVTECRHDGWKDRLNPTHARGLRAPGERSSPWNVALVICATLGGALGVSIAAAGSMTAWMTMGAAMGLVGGLLLTHAEPERRIAVVGLVALLLLAVGSAVSAPSPFIAAAPWLAFSGLYVHFRDSSYHSLKHWVVGPRTRVKQLLGKVLLLIMGRSTAEALEKLRASRPTAEHRES